MHAKVLKYVRIWLCALDAGAGLLFAAGALWLAMAGASPRALDVFGAGVWLWLAAIAVAGFYLQSAPSSESAWRRAAACPDALKWASAALALAALAAACAVLFAHGLTAPATAAEILLLMRLQFARRDPEPSCSGCRNRIREDKWWSVRFEYPLLLGGAVWVALGAPPSWTEATIVTGLWIVAIWSIAGAAMEYGAPAFIDFMQPELDRRFRARFPDDGPSRQTRDYPPEPKPHWLHRAVRWLVRIGVLVAAWGLWTSGHPDLAVVLVAGLLAGIAWSVSYRRTNYGPAIEIDPVGRLLHRVLRLPLIVVGLLLIVALCVSVTIIAAPLLLLSPAFERFIPWGREKRVRDKRIAEQADGSKLCPAFDRPHGFIYFLYAAPHQYEHFMAEDSVLTLSGLPVIARDWKRDVAALKKELGSRAFKKTPEGILLRYAGARSTRDSVPLAVIVAPVGLPTVCRFASVYRTRAAKPQRLEDAERSVARAMTWMLKQRRFKHRA